MKSISRSCRSVPALVAASLVAMLLLVMTAYGGAAFAEQDAQTQRAIESMMAASRARAAIVRQVSPAVVHISVEKTLKSGDGNGHGEGNPDVFEDEFFKRFFAPRLPVPPREFRQRGLGSGAIVDPRGYIITNNHVVGDADRIIVKMQNGDEFEAKLVGADPATDIAVLKIEGKDLPVAQLGDSDALEVGETVIAIGNPFGLEQTVTQGIVSAKGRSSVGLTDYEDFIQTDASINPGNSGGPLINVKGQIVGVNTAIFSRSGGSMGIGFAIPIKMVSRVMTSLIEKGKVTRGFLGVVIQDVTKELADALGVAVHGGVLIANVGPDTPAGKGGMRQGDVVVRFNGGAVSSSTALRYAVASVEPGVIVPVDVMREGKALTLKVTIEEQPNDMRAAIQLGQTPEGGSSEPPGVTPEHTLGMDLQPLTPEIARQLGYGGVQGVLVTNVEQGGPAAEAGLRRGTLIEEVNRLPVANLQAFRTQVQKTPQGKSLLLLVRFGETKRFLVLQKP